MIDMPNIMSAFVMETYPKPVSLIKNNDTIFHIISVGHLKTVFGYIADFSIIPDNFGLPFATSAGKKSLSDICFKVNNSDAYDRRKISPELSTKLIRLYCMADAAAYCYQYFVLHKQVYNGKYVPIPKKMHLQDLVTKEPSSKNEQFIVGQQKSNGGAKFLSMACRPNVVENFTVSARETDESSDSETDTSYED